MSNKYKVLLSMTPTAWKTKAKEQVKIDKHSLDDVCATQPQLYMEWASLLAKAIRFKKETEEEVLQLQAETNLDIRENPKYYKLMPDSKGKLMESAIKAVVLVNVEVKAAQKKALVARELADVMTAIVSSFEQRRTMIKMMGDLWIAEYYSDTEIKASKQTAMVRKTRKKK